MRPTFSAASLLVLAAFSSAQQVRAGAVAVAYNQGVGDVYIVAGRDEIASGSSLSNTLNDYRTAFTGFDRTGFEQTMDFRASAYAESTYGRLRARTSSGIDNSFYDEANVPFRDGGAPDSVGAFGIAGFTDTLQFGGIGGGAYTARYVFHIDGFVDGSDAFTYTTLSVKIGNNQAEVFEVPRSASGFFEADFATQGYAVNPTDPQFNLPTQTADVLFTTRTLHFTEDLEDGSSHFGATDFSSTARVAGVLLYDAGGNLVSNYTVTGASGTTYPQAVPEPASLAAFGLGTFGLLRRRSRRSP